MFVISIKRHCNYRTKFSKCVFEYLGTDIYTPYPIWTKSLHEANLFKTANEAKRFYIDSLSIISCNWAHYYKNSIRICKVEFKPVEVLPWKENC